MRYEWFQNRADFKGVGNGININFDTIVIELLDKNKQFMTTAKGGRYKIGALVKFKTEKNENRNIGICLKKNKVFLIRLDSEKKYDSNVVYNKKDFLRLATIVSRKFKAE